MMRNVSVEIMKQIFKVVGVMMLLRYGEGARVSGDGYGKINGLRSTAHLDRFFRLRGGKYQQVVSRHTRAMQRDSCEIRVYIVISYRIPALPPTL
jgi:hypothetical protein